MQKKTHGLAKACIIISIPLLHVNFLNEFNRHALVELVTKCHPQMKKIEFTKF